MLKADISAKLDENKSAMDRLRADMSQRETRLILAVAVIIGIGLTIFGFLTTPPAP